MQEKIRLGSSKSTIRRHTTKEERQLHVENWKKSGLSMSEYCREQEIKLTSFSAWVQTEMKNKQQFQPLSVKSVIEEEKTVNRIEIITSAGIKIRLEDVKEPALVISIARGLM